MKRSWGTLYGVGVAAPGGPGWLALRVAQLIRQADKVCYPVNECGESLVGALLLRPHLPVLLLRFEKSPAQREKRT